MEHAQNHRSPVESAPIDYAEPFLNVLVQGLVEILQLAACLCDAADAVLVFFSGESSRWSALGSDGRVVAVSSVLQMLNGMILHHNDVYVIPATLDLTDRRFAPSPSAAPPRLFAGIPLRMWNREAFGSLLIMDAERRTLSAAQKKALRLLARQAIRRVETFQSIAGDNETLFRGLQHSNLELMQAYDTTIEGWSAALDLRDRETDGHSRRVTEMTLSLARQVGVSEEELVHMRRGALLHDIGKMGIPDSILLKPGPLTEDEWKIMRQHPIFAYEILSPIAFLRPALDIPYYHHEKWDGSGYPHGLREKQIPLAARIFAVVDVWDALCSDRPYRRGWPKEKALRHIQSLAGIHFDPDIVNVFLAFEGA